MAARESMLVDQLAKVAQGDRADSFDFYVRVEEIVGTRAVVDFAAHGQALETTSNELLELTEMLLRQSVSEAAGAEHDGADVQSVHGERASRAAGALTDRTPVPLRNCRVWVCGERRSDVSARTISRGHLAPMQGRT